MKKKLLFLFIAIASSIFIYAMSYKQDIPPGIDESQWINITNDFGVYIENMPSEVGPSQKQSLDKKVKVIDKKSIKGVFIVRKDGKWYYIENISQTPHIIPAK